MTGEKLIYKVVFLSKNQEDSNMNQEKTHIWIHGWAPFLLEGYSMGGILLRVKMISFVKMYLKEEKYPP